MLTIIDHPTDASRVLIRFSGSSEPCFLSVKKTAAEELRRHLNERASVVQRPVDLDSPYGRYIP